MVIAMQTSTVSLDAQSDRSATFTNSLNDPLADERVVSEQYLADLLGTHIQQVRVGRRKDAEGGTVGERVPVPIWISDRRVGYQVKAIKDWLAKRTGDPISPAA